MSVAIGEYNRTHRIEFAQEFCRNADIQSVAMGFFDAATRQFSDAWAAQSLHCSPEAIRNLVKMAEAKLIAHTLEARQHQLANSATSQADQPYGDYPIWQSKGPNVIGIGAPIHDIYGHSPSSASG